jgi:hypothetical protein
LTVERAFEWLIYAANKAGLSGEAATTLGNGQIRAGIASPRGPAR